MGSTDTHLFTPLAIRSLTLRNRVAVSPMCQYSGEDGFPSDWHFVHLGSRAIGGAGLVIIEACSISPEGRITPQDLGIWKDEHIAPLARIAGFLKQYGAVAGIQLAHAGRKASTRQPWEGGTTIPEDEGGWQTLAPSPVPFRSQDPPPLELTVEQIAQVVKGFATAAERALQAGFQIIELHGAHGYLIHEFLSPLTNQRTDQYGGPLENRARLLLEVTRAVRRVWPESLPLFVRISATDWVPGGWDIEESIAVARMLKEIGVDLIDCSSGGAVGGAKIPLTPAYQTPFAERIKAEAGILTGAVGLITEAEQADAIIREQRADLILLARAMLRNPYWPIHAAKQLGQELPVPVQYQRAF